jgi:class 3 adenylate cyclase
VAWVGVVGETGAHDFTVLGDVPNTVARLGSAGRGGELVMSDQIVEAASVDTTGLEPRLLDLKGKAEPFSAWVGVAVGSEF